jgi:peptidoglycan/xylan/chitin deacetylase (PgdA/CDA1 family)
MITYFTSSWDDGHRLDMRIAEMLCKYSCPGTFYVPCRNRNNDAVLSPAEVRTIAQEHEIGSHTLDHCYLDKVTMATARAQITSGRYVLEDCIGRPVKGFAYPGGRHNRRIRRLVQDAAFSYARTVECFALQLRKDPFRMPTTIQLHPHRRSAYIRNFVKWGHWHTRIHGLLAALNRRELPLRLSAILDLASRRGGVLHLWGHSWEVQALDLWPILDDFLKQVTERIPESARVTNFALQQIKAYQGVA